MGSKATVALFQTSGTIEVVNKLLDARRNVIETFGEASPSWTISIPAWCWRRSDGTASPRTYSTASGSVGMDITPAVSPFASPTCRSDRIENAGVLGNCVSVGLL